MGKVNLILNKKNYIFVVNWRFFKKDPFCVELTLFEIAFLYETEVKKIIFVQNWRVLKRAILSGTDAF